MTFAIDGLARTLDGRLDAYERSAAKDWRLFEEAGTRDIDLAGRPIALLGAGAVWAQGFVQHVATHHKVIAAVDNFRVGETRPGYAFVDDAGFLDMARQEPELVAIMCCASDGAVAHFAALAEKAGVPVLSLFQAMRREGQLGFGAGHGEPHVVKELAGIDPHAVFGDELSVATFYRLLLHRLGWSRQWLDPIRLPMSRIYFGTGVFDITGDEVVVDGGAYDGDTARAFLAHTGGKVGHIHAFEPDAANAAAFRRHFNGRDDMTINEAGLWSETTSLAFHADGGLGSSLDEGAVTRIPVVALDDTPASAASLIKLDIEGAELQALAGGRRAIARSKPKLAICAYHLPYDLRDLTRAILDIRPDYRLFLRHHSPWLTDTVIYAA